MRARPGLVTGRKVSMSTDQVHKQRQSHELFTSQKTFYFESVFKIKNHRFFLLILKYPMFNIFILICNELNTKPKVTKTEMK